MHIFAIFIPIFQALVFKYIINLYLKFASNIFYLYFCSKNTNVINDLRKRDEKVIVFFAFNRYCDDWLYYRT